MDPLIYEEMIVQENSHWWFLARKRIMGHLLGTLKLPPNPTILDAGCGSGGNLSMLSRLGGKLYAFEIYDKAREQAQSLNLATIESGKLPDAIPFPGVMFDLIALFDVLEHVEDDKASLAALAARLKPGGILCLNVPAYQWLFTKHDRLHHHFRRYNKSQLLGMLKDAGLHVDYASYWNITLFPIAMIVRMIDGLSSKNYAIGAAIPRYKLNPVLKKLVSVERHFLLKTRLPFGLSIVVLAHKPAN